MVDQQPVRIDFNYAKNRNSTKQNPHRHWKEIKIVVPRWNFFKIPRLENFNPPLKGM